MSGTNIHPFLFRFRHLPDKRVLITNDTGGNIVLPENIFDELINGRLSTSNCPKNLIEQGFIREHISQEIYCKELALRYFLGWRAPHVHIISLSADCNLACRYCCASTTARDKRRMNKETADKILSFIFSMRPERYLFEFQGGEPLLSFPLLKYFVLKAKKIAIEQDKQVFFSVVTNLWECDDEKFDFLTKNGITVCASLDGPAKVHDKNRPCLGGSSHKKTVFWLKKFADFAASNNTEAPNAICTVTKNSLPYAREIIDEFLGCGLKRVQLGPVDPLGRAKVNWNEIGVSAGEFLKFYNQAIEYILQLNKDGVAVYEKAALAFAKQVNGAVRPRYQNLDMFYRLAYNWNGAIYGSDEARMLANSGDETFCLGSVFEDSFDKLLRKPFAIRLLLSALSELRQPLCSRCPSVLYCHVPPVYNYLTQHSIEGNMPSNGRCILYKSVYDLMSYLNSDSNNAEIFRKWSDMYD